MDVQDATRLGRNSHRSSPASRDSNELALCRKAPSKIATVNGNARVGLKNAMADK
ncbi:hypothetical protein PENSUB_2009 [Penicillium subrubescens]|uniref:Uncharacterized protein n=1 Tax=Penicillium subrubescens TaxID=1316194 RepID=A0A1Q5UII8_9EURO|nr:hypothetical protein PENSUB_2009 [Penicillium subrubescens]